MQQHAPPMNVTTSTTPQDHLDQAEVVEAEVEVAPPPPAW